MQLVFPSCGLSQSQQQQLPQPPQQDTQPKPQQPLQQQLNEPQQPPLQQHSKIDSQSLEVNLFYIF